MDFQRPRRYYASRRRHADYRVRCKYHCKCPRFGNSRTKKNRKCPVAPFRIVELHRANHHRCRNIADQRNRRRIARRCHRGGPIGRRQWRQLNNPKRELCQCKCFDYCRRLHISDQFHTRRTIEWKFDARARTVRVYSSRIWTGIYIRLSRIPHNQTRQLIVVCQGAHSESMAVSD